MTFKHKLSRRLAMLRDMAVAFSAVALSACTGDQPAPSQPNETNPTHVGTSVTAPTTATVLLQESFEDNGFAARGWYDNASPVLTTAQHTAGSSALEMQFPVGASVPVAGGAMRHLFAPTPTLYVSYWVKYSSNWVGSGRSYHPHEFYVLSNQDGDWDGPASNWLTLYIEENYQNGGIPRLALQDNKAINSSLGTPPVNLAGVTENRSTGGCNGITELNIASECFSMPPWYNDKQLSASQVWFQPAPGAGYKGNWNHVEAYFQLNSIVAGIGVADGVMQYWFNGAPVIDRHDILFRTGARPAIQFHQFLIAPYIGDGSPVNQTMWVDDLALATGRIATDSSSPPPSPPPPPPPPPVTTDPGTVTDLAVAGAADSTVTLSFTQVTGGAGQPARYAVRFAPGTITWWLASDVQLGTCGVPLAGTAIGATLSCDVRGLTPSTAYQFQLVSFRGTLDSNAVFGGLSNVVSATTTATVTNPGRVTNLSVASVTDSSATLSFIEVNDGTGHPAAYEVRYAVAPLTWWMAPDVTRGTCKVPLAGTSIGAKRTCRVLGLRASTSYQFELVAFRGTLNVDAVFGDLSNVASRTTPAKVLPVASVTLGPASASFAVGTTQQFTATLKDSLGTTLTGRTVTWTSSDAGIAAVNGTGMATGVAAGSATITATSQGVSGTAAVTVTSALPTDPGTVTDLAVSNVSDTAVTLTFTEVPDGAGHAASYDVRQAVAPLSWGVANQVQRGTCRTPMSGTTAGAARSCTVAGLVAGTSYQFELVAFRGTLDVDAVFGGLSNVVSATTTSTAVPQPPPPAVPPPPPPPAPPPPSPPPSSGTWAHEPSGFTVIQDEGWENGLLNSYVLYDISADKPITVENITGSLLGQSKALQIGYLPGHQGGGGTEARWDIPVAQRRYEMFVGYYVQVNPQWQGHFSAINKMIFLADGGSSGFSAMWYEMFGSGSSPLSLYVVNQSGGSPGGMHENTTPANFSRGVWHKVEIYQKQGSPGIVRVWVDDVLYIDRSDVYTRNAPIDAVAISGIWGGVGDSKQQFDYMRFDNMHVSVR